MRYIRTIVYIYYYVITRLFLFSVPVSFSIKSKEDAIATVLRPALHLEQSSDEEMQQTDNNIANTTEMVDISQQVNQDQSKAKSIINNCDALNQSSVDCEQSDSFIRDTMLEQQNRDEKRQIKRGMLQSLVF